MTLATRCPHCHTTFRVAHDQLKLRAGLVRCGACKQIFNGIENLVPTEDLQPVPSRTPGEPAAGEPAAGVPAAGVPAPGIPAAGAPTVGASLLGASSSFSPSRGTFPPAAPVPPSAANAGPENSRFMAYSDRDAGGLPNDAQRPPPVHPASGLPAPASSHLDDRAATDPLLRMTLLDFVPLKRRSADEADAPAVPPPTADLPDPIEKAIEDLQHRMPRNADAGAAAGTSVRIEPTMTGHADERAMEKEEAVHADDESYEEPRFMRQGRRRQRVGRKLRLAMLAGSAVLTLLLAVQAFLISRNQIAAANPQLRPFLTELCAHLGCRIQLPAQIEAVSIESSELQVLNPETNAFLLTTLLRNRSATPQAWPNLELTLTDEGDKPIARRVFTARDYLPASSNIERGFGPRSEQTFKIHFQLSQLKAAGYRVYLFYP